MAKKISFSHFSIEEGVISLDYHISSDSSEEKSGNLYFKLTPAIKPRNDLIAIALSTFCVVGYDEVEFALPISSKLKSRLEEITGAYVKSEGIDDHQAVASRKAGNVILSFSGGFDSLAAKALLPANTKLVSLDFGGRFARERKFFETFDTCIVETNLVETPLRFNNWSFMGIAAMLFSDYLEAKYYAFGQIFEAEMHNFSDKASGTIDVADKLFEAAGMQQMPVVLGLTEIATLNIAARTSTEVFRDSLNSLANPGEEKRYRKQVLAQIAEQRFGLDLNLELVPPPARQHFRFGDNYAVDFLALYIIKYAGMEIASHTIRDIPTEALMLVEELSLDFYDKVNPNFLAAIPEPLRLDYMDKLSEQGILSFTKTDWNEFIQVRNFLSRYHIALAEFEDESGALRIEDRKAGQIDAPKNPAGQRAWICNKVTGKDVLSVGSDFNGNLAALGERDFRVTVVDSSLNTAEIADGSGITCVQEDFGSFTPDVQFDTVIMDEALELQLYPEIYLERAYRCLKDNGRLIITATFGLDENPKRKQTFYYWALRNLIEKFFTIKETNFFGRIIGFVAVKGNAASDETSLLMECLRVEQVFHTIEDEAIKKYTQEKEARIQDHRQYQEELNRIRESREKNKLDNKLILDKKNETIAQHWQELVKLRNDNLILRRENTSAQNEHKKQNDAHNAAREALKKEIAILEDNIRAAEVSLKKLSEEKNSAEQEILVCKDTIENLMAERDRIQKEYAELEMRLDTANAHAIELEQQLVEENLLRDQVEQQYASTLEEKQVLENEKADLEQKKQVLESEKADLEQKKQALENEKMALLQEKQTALKNAAEVDRAKKLTDKKLIELSRKHAELQHKQEVLDTRYKALSNSKLGKLTLWMWKMKKAIAAQFKADPEAKSIRNFVKKIPGVRGFVLLIRKLKGGNKKPVTTKALPAHKPTELVVSVAEDNHSAKSALPAVAPEIIDPALLPSISVIIPTYKMNDTVECCVASVLEQDYPAEKIEVILAVNGNDAEYAQWLKERYEKESRVQVVHTTVAGASAGRNYGKKFANGEFATYLDDDDYFTKGFLKEMAQNITENTTVVCGRMIDLEGDTLIHDGYINKALEKAGAGVHPNPWKLQSMFSSPCAKLFRTSQLLNVWGDFDESLAHTEDTAFWIENMHKPMGECFACASDSDQAYVRRKLENSRSRPSGEKAFAFYITDRIKLVERFADELLHEERSVDYKRFVLNKIQTSVNFMVSFYRESTPEDQVRIRELVNASDCIFLNKGLFAEKRAIAFCHNFAPAVDASAFVASKRLQQLNKHIGENLAWTVVTADMRNARASDPMWDMFFAKFQYVNKLVVPGNAYFSEAAQVLWGEKAFDLVKDEEVPYIYSRSLWAGSHVAALKYKEAHPDVFWIAEFSDPLYMGKENTPRKASKEYTGDQAYLNTFWQDLEIAVFQKADQIIYTNANQCRYMLEYNPQDASYNVPGKSLIWHHPRIDARYANIIPTDYRLDDDNINIGYFGTFYQTRSADEMLMLLDNQKVHLHIFTNVTPELEAQMKEISGRIHLHPLVSHLEVFSISKKMDYLFLNDILFDGEYTPYLPSKLADYLSVGTAVLGMVYPNTPMSEMNEKMLIKFSGLDTDFVRNLKKTWNPTE